MAILNPFSNQYHAFADLAKHYNKTYAKTLVFMNNKSNISIIEGDRSGGSKALVIAKTVVILIASIALFPMGALVFRSLVNRMTLQKVDGTLANEDVFKGSIKFGQYYKGHLKSKGETFEGQWSDLDNKTASLFIKGIKKIKDGTVYEGQFNTNGYLIGKGKITYPKKNAQNQLIIKSQIGNFIDGQLSGKGQEEYVFNSDKIVFKCDGYKNGIRNGYGSRTCNGKLTYKGEWSNGDQNGKGKSFYHDGSIYQGQFNEGLRNGQGLYKTIDGYRYEGQWSAGKANGQGKATTVDKSIFEGRFENGICRKGTLIKPDGTVIGGTWNEEGVLES